MKREVMRMIQTNMSSWIVMGREQFKLQSFNGIDWFCGFFREVDFTKVKEMKKKNFQLLDVVDHAT
jgi:hypothetical protein